MTRNRLSRAAALGLAVLGVLAAVWVLPPAMHALKRLCPVRPDGVNPAAAVPAYSRKYGYSCSQCHVTYPLLNAFGRRFKINGYTTGDEAAILKSQDGELWTEKLYPLSAIVRARPFDNGKSTVGNSASMWNGGSTGTQGFKLQPVNDVDMFVAGGDVAKHVSWFGELDANVTNFTPATGDLQLGYHPFSFLNFLLARKNFYAMDPYQTLSGMSSPTIAPRAIDGVQPDQNGLSGNILTEQTQTLEISGLAENDKLGALYYAAGATTGNNDNPGTSAKNANFRLAFDTLKGFMVGGFGSFGHESPATIPANGGNANNPIAGVVVNPGDPAGRIGVAGYVSQVRFAKTGVDAVVEFGNVVARGAFLYSYDSDPMVVSGGFRKMRDRAAYAEAEYVFHLPGSDVPFLVPLVRENWYTTYNNKRQFNYLTFQLAHYFAPNFKAFVEGSVDTKTGPQGWAIAPNASRVSRGGRFTGQIEVGF